MPAIIMHAGAGVLLIIMTNFASPKANNKKQNHKSQNKTKSKQAPSLTYPHPKYINNTKSAPKSNITTKRPAPYNKLTAEIQCFQMSKMHQT